MSDGTERWSTDELRAHQADQTPEFDHQEQIIRWAQARSTECEELELLHAVPNRHHPGARAEPGILAGIPDLFLPVPLVGPAGDVMHHGLYIELKRPSGSLSAAQKDMIPRLRGMGYRVQVCYGADEAISEIARYVSIQE